MSNWQPIETAPKDGTRILSFSPTGDDLTINIVQWGFAAPFPEQLEWVTDNVGAGYTYTPDPPTHWMPLPDGPAADG